MLALQIDFLTGRYVATAFNDRRSGEWPPHPARVFSALVAAWGDAEPHDEAEREALMWLERQDPPEIAASEAASRDVVTVFVPVNDSTVVGKLELDELDAAESALDFARAASDRVTGKEGRAATKGVEQAQRQLERLRGRVAAAMQPDAKDTKEGPAIAVSLLPEHRGRQPRTFPSMAPDDPIVHLVWRNALPSDEVRSALARLALRAVRVGHSSSLVRCAIVGDAPPSTWIPDPEGREVLRGVNAGQFARLEIDWVRFRETEPRVLTYSPDRYRRVGNPVAEGSSAARSSFGADWIVLRRVEGPTFPSVRAVDVATAVRGALMRHADQPAWTVITGHAAGGAPAATPHVAVVPLSFVGSRHADGRILGVAIVLPRECTAEERRHVLRAIGRWEESARCDGEETPTLDVTLGAAGVLRVERVVVSDAPAHGLRSATWCRPARTWISVTPVALDRNPGKLRSNYPDPRQRAVTEARAAGEARATVVEACRRVGLPEPVSVVIHPSVTLLGTSKAAAFPPFPADPSRTRRAKVHVELQFAAPVEGPILLGAGRYLGLGLFRPMEDDRGEDTQR